MLVMMNDNGIDTDFFPFCIVLQDLPQVGLLHSVFPIPLVQISGILYAYL